MPSNSFRAVIWDMDGVIADTGKYHFQAWQETFRRHGAAFTEADFRKMFGQRNDTIVNTTMPGRTDAEIDAIAAEKEERYRQLVAGKVEALPGVLKLLKLMKQHTIKMAIASSAPPENIRLVMHDLKVDDYFDAIVFGREVKEGKPSPQVYLLAAQKLGVSPAECVVIEDAVAGVAGAKRGGMKCIAVTTTHSREALQEADLIVDSLESLNFTDFEKLFNSKKEGL